jgi:uncharacterized membrane protein YphA (DoxX/SURF4 family)
LDILFLLGRIILGGYFVYAGVNHFMQLGAMTQYSQFKRVPAPKVAVIVSGLMLIAGGLSILLGYQVVIGAWLLIVFLVPTTIMMHDFWTESDPMARGNQKAHFLKVIALAGAALIISTIPAWPISLGG